MKAAAWFGPLLLAGRNVLLGGNLMSLGLLPQPRRLVSYVNENLFLYKTISGTRGLPQKNVFEVLPAGPVAPITLVLPRAAGGENEVWLHEIASYGADL